MYDAFFEERHLIPDGRYHELKFEDLEADPMSQMKAIYDSLSLDDFDRFEPRLRQYVDSLAQYRKNSYPRMPEELRLKIRRAWRRSFEAWGYSV
jgi:hypothetical protein